jgi:hypothetical protein
VRKNWWATDGWASWRLSINSLLTLLPRAPLGVQPLPLLCCRSFEPVFISQCIAAFTLSILAQKHNSLLRLPAELGIWCVYDLLRAILGGAVDFRGPPKG